MNIDFFQKFTKYHLTSFTSPEDLSDRLNYLYSSCILIVFITLIGIRQYFFTPIQCWIPHQWARSWEEYAENYCWVQNTYYSSVPKGPPKSIKEREANKITYYQWVPFMLALQCICFYLPHIVWKVIGSRIGTNIGRLIKTANEVALDDRGKRSQRLELLSSEIIRLMNAKLLQCDWHTEPEQRAMHDHGDHDEDTQFPHLLIGKNKRKTTRNKSVCQRIHEASYPLQSWRKRSGHILIYGYALVKLLYLVNGCAQIALMRHFIDAHNRVGYAFGWRIARDLAGGRNWRQTGMFPRVTWCDVDRRVVGNVQRTSFMCVLPVNMLNEKLFVFLWFWCVFCVLVSFASLIGWTTRMSGLSRRHAFIRRYLHIVRVPSADNTALTRAFVERFLRSDGVFILMMISRNVGELVASELVEIIWKDWFHMRERLLANQQRQQQHNQQQEQQQEQQTQELRRKKRRKSSRRGEIV